MLRYSKFLSGKLSGSLIVRLGLLVLVTAVAAGLVTRVVWKSSANALNTSSDVPVAASSKQRIEGELIALGPNGFEPKQIRRDVGKPFLLSVENRSGLPVVSLALESNVGLPVLTTRLARERRLWSDVLHLPRGVYTLKESDHSDWICTITVE